MARPFPVVLALLAVLAACRAEPPVPEPVAPDAPPVRVETPAETTVVASRTPEAPTPFDAAAVVFDTVEPPEQTVRIPPRPPPAPPTAPPAPAPPSRPPPLPTTRGPSGSCDVRATEGYCFAFTGEAWAPAAARARCEAAPGTAYDPGSCPLADRVATCAYTPPSSAGREIVYTYYAPYDIALAELACPGTFTRIE